MLPMPDALFHMAYFVVVYNNTDPLYFDSWWSDLNEAQNQARTLWNAHPSWAVFVSEGRYLNNTISGA